MYNDACRVSYALVFLYLPQLALLNSLLLSETRVYRESNDVARPGASNAVFRL